MVRNSALLLLSQQHLKDSCMKEKIKSEWSMDDRP
jgi:hypothetical protein